MKDVYWIGMDYHKETTTLAVLRNHAPEIVQVHNTASTPSRLYRVLDRYAALGTVQCCYEASSCGYTLARTLQARGLACTVIAPHSLARSVETRVKKTDRLDAVQLARQFRAGSLSPVAVPTPAQEEVRRYVRWVDELMSEVRRQRTRISLWCLQTGHSYDGTTWTQRHHAWLQHLALPVRDRAQLTHRMRVLTLLEQERDEAAVQCAVHVEATDTAQIVPQLQALRGINHQRAMVLWAELWDGQRFANAKQLMSYVGLDCREHSSGSRQCRGSITKQGNARCRRALVDAAQSYRSVAGSSPVVHRRRRELPAAVCAIAQRAETRLAQRYQRLFHRTGSALKTRVAVARELTGFVWALLQPTLPEMRA